MNRDFSDLWGKMKQFNISVENQKNKKERPTHENSIFNR